MSNHQKAESTVFELLRDSIPTSEVVSDAAGEVYFRIPFNTTPLLPDLFDEIDKNKKKYGIEK